VQLLVVQAHRAAVGVDPQRSDLEEPRLASVLGPAQQGVQARPQLHVLHGTGDEVIGARVERAQHIRLASVGAEHDHGKVSPPGIARGRIGASTDPLQELERAARRVQFAEHHELWRSCTRRDGCAPDVLGEVGGITVCE